MIRIGLFASLILVIACVQNRPHPIAYGKDQCVYCKMTISDQKFGAAVVTQKGRTYYYDAAECTIDHLAEDAVAPHDIYAVGYNDPGILHPVDSLIFVISNEFRSPMGANLAAFVKEDLDALAVPGERLDWQQVRERLSDD